MSAPAEPNEIARYAHTSHAGPITDYDRLVEQAQAYASESHSKNTLRAYKHAWSRFTSWCESKSADPLRKDDREALVGLHLADVASTLKPTSLGAAVAGIRHYYHVQGRSFDTTHPAISSVLRGVRRAKGSRPTQKTPLTVRDLKAMVEALPNTLLGHRDRAILLLGFSGAFRRSELVALKVEDLELTNEGYLVILRRSKTDQLGEGLEKAIPFGNGPTCPCQAIHLWLTLSGIKEGFLFRSIDRHGRMGASLSDRAVAEIIKRNPVLKGREGDFSGHSLRSGLCTAAAVSRCPEHVIMAQSGHKSSAMVQRYIRTGLQFKDNAAAVIGL